MLSKSTLPVLYYLLFIHFLLFDIFCIDMILNEVSNCALVAIAINKMFVSYILNYLMTAVSKALGGASKLERILNIWTAGKLFYALSTWGLALAG